MHQMAATKQDVTPAPNHRHWEPMKDGVAARSPSRSRRRFLILCLEWPLSSGGLDTPPPGTYNEGIVALAVLRALMGRGALTSVGRTLVASGVFPHEASGSCWAKFFASPIFRESLPVRAPVIYRGPFLSETSNRDGACCMNGWHDSCEENRLRKRAEV
jgi:hypothetical protein